MSHLLTPLVTALVAACIALAVPVSQVRWVEIERSCCCPDPDACHCPHDEPGPDSLNTCHATQESFVSPALAAFTQPPAIAMHSPVQIIVRAHHALAWPHAAPNPRRPDAPS